MVRRVRRVGRGKLPALRPRPPVSLFRRTRSPCALTLLLLALAQAGALKMAIEQGAKSSEVLEYFEQYRLKYLKNLDENAGIALPTLSFRALVIEPDGRYREVSLDEAAALLDGETDLHEVSGMCPKKVADGRVGSQARPRERPHSRLVGHDGRAHVLAPGRVAIRLCRR